MPSVKHLFEGEVGQQDSLGGPPSLHAFTQGLQTPGADRPVAHARARGCQQLCVESQLGLGVALA
ncbi:MAG: hypothetical protein ACLP0J_28290 [Solirubrobacteraceae bacterium]